jgi:hypothetical protein
MGAATAEALEMRFDEQLARDSMAIYALGEIPAVRDDLPFGVSQVRFRADVTQMTQADRSALEEAGSAVRALLPE